MTTTIDNPRTFKINRDLRIAHVTAPKERWFVQFYKWQEWQITAAYTRIGTAMQAIRGMLKDDPTRFEEACDWILE
ncbi:hypothetical protein [Rhizobium sp. MHM7A]|uniref:hypothetical protein n=1 Tax=Rhizobium sp. MHM7A TaxID=2583233 RepID=UPI00110673FA|nr:hypothetical protein [Rhizobium sp. MHM7A]TLX12079.1 hypothetical protein FFR93_16030 [Rhizobium sp. MHM7A]